MKISVFVSLFMLIGLLSAQNTIIEGEYFFNGDPGFGNGTPLSFSADSVIDINFNADISSLGDGYHILFVRLKDDSLRWSLVNKILFYKGPAFIRIPNPEITSINYYLSKGAEKTPVQYITDFTPSGDIDVTFNADLSGLEYDSTYYLHTYLKDENGLISQEYIHEFLNLEAQFSISLRGADEVAGDVVFDYAIRDPLNRIIDLRCEFRKSPSEFWSVATVSGDTSDLDTDQYEGTITWHSLADVGEMDIDNIEFRISFYSGDLVGVDDKLFHLDNFHGQTVTIELMETLEVYRDTVSINYSIVDPTSDEQILSIMYQVENEIWKNATIIQNISALDSNNYSNTIDWQSSNDLPGTNPINVRLTAVANDGWQNGIGDTTGFFILNNNLPPSVTLDNTVENTEQSGDISINYLLNDSENDTLDIEIQFSVDDGSSLRPATVSGSTSQIDAANYESSFTWHSAIDLPSVDIDKVILITKVSDWVNGTVDTVAFHLDNNQIPGVIIVEMSGEQSRDVPFQIILSDAESDTLLINCFYRLDGESLWKVPTISTNLDGLLPGEEEYPIIWESLSDIPEYSGYLWFRVIPSDNDSGVADSVYILVDNLGVPIVTNLSQPTGEQRSDVLFEYQIQDDEADLVSLSSHYSTDSLNWISATIEGSTTGIDTFNYKGSVVWKSDQDLPGKDLFKVWIRLIPSDTHTGLGKITNSFHLDNNQIPVVQAGLIDIEVSGSVKIPYQIQDAESDTIDLIVNYSKNSSEWTEIIRETVIVQNYQDTLNWNSLSELGYGLHENITINITPIDNDSGITQQSNSFNIYNYAGDYTGDITINYEDLIPFAVAWNSPQQDLSKEIGPARGQPPLLIPEPDGVIDFKDLMVLVRQWNWSYDNGQSLGKKILFSNQKNENSTFNFNTLYNESESIEYNLTTANSSALNFNLEDRELKDIISLEQSDYDPWQNQFADQLTIRFDSSAAIMAISFEIFYDQDVISIYNIENLFLSDRNGFSFNNDDSTSGIIQYSSVVLDQANLSEITNEMLLKLQIAVKKEQKTDIQINSKIYDYSGLVISHGQQSFELMSYDQIPESFTLFQNYPNPFNPQTTIKYQLSEAGEVNLEIYNILGQLVTILFKGNQKAGYYERSFNNNNLTSELSSGLYILHLRAIGNNGNRFIKNIKMVLLK